MTTVLNRKFDLLCHSGTCPSYLVDVLSLLVAHANDTELFKSELRTIGGGTASTEGASQSGFSLSRGPSAIRSDHAAREVSERFAADRRTQLMYRQVEDPEALEDALRASHESVLIAAEQSLQTYAEDLKHMNEIALATSAKQLRAMRVETQQQMESFRDRVCASVVSQTRDELDVMRSELGTSIKEDVSEMVRQLHETSISGQRQVKELTTSFAEFVAQAHEATAVAPLTDVHEALTAVAYVQEKVEYVEAAAASRTDLETLQERLRELERTVATLGTAVSVTQVAARSGPSEAATPTFAAPLVPAAPPVPILETSSTLASSLSLSNAQQHALTSRPASRPPSGPQGNAKLVSTNHHTTTNNNGTSRKKNDTASSPSTTPPPPAAAAPVVKKSCADRLGVTVESAEEGVVLSQVLPDSAAAQHQLGAGHIISHVGRVPVTTPAAFEAALQASEGQALKLTTYDPFQGRVRVLTIQPTSSP